jgi:drug/metabolite transporter (DMT)-like permease
MDFPIVCIGACPVAVVILMTSQTREQRRGWLAGLLAAALFGSSAPLIGSLSHGPSPVLVAGLLYAGAALVLLPLAVAEAPTSRHAPIQRQDLPLLGLITLLGGIAGPIALVKGLALLTPGASALLLNLEAVFTVLIAVGVGKEHLGRDGWAVAALTLTGALVLSAGPLGGSQWQGVLWIALACLCWGIDNNLSQRLSLRNPLQISAAKALGAALPMLAVAQLQGHPVPFVWMSAALLGIGSLGYGVSIWLDMVALASLGAAREAVVFSTAPFLGALVAVALLGSPLSPSLLLAAAAMALSTGLLLRSSHGHWHLHAELDHQHRHFHAPVDGDAHHIHPHRPEDLADLEPGQPFWHSHRHRHDPLAHEHPHVSDVHHRHQH